MKTKVTVNGREPLSIVEREDGIFIPRSAIEGTQPIKGKIASAYYCESEEGIKKWKVELHKPFARLIRKTNYICWYESREMAKDHVEAINKLIQNL